MLAAENDREGIEHLRASFDMYHRLPSTNAATLRFCTGALVSALRRFGDVEAAIDVYEGLIAGPASGSPGDVDPVAQAEPKRELASLLRQEGRHERALELLMEVLALYEEAFPASDPRVTNARRELEAALVE